MAMALSTSRVLSLLILPSCFRCLACVASPEEESSRRLDAPSPRPARRIPGHGKTVVVDDNDDDRRDGNVQSLGELLASEAEKTGWIDEQKRSIAEAMQRTGSPYPRWNDGGDNAGRRKANTFQLRELSAYEIKKRRWIAAQKRPMAQALRGWSKPGPRRSGSDPAKPWSLPVRVTYAGHFGPESDAAFLKDVIAAGKSGGHADTATQRDSDEWSEMEEARLRRQRYLRNYCPFQSEEEQQEEEESVPEETKAVEAPDDAAEVERTEPVQPANDPGTEASIIEKNGDGGVSNKVPFPGAGEVRIHDDDYYAARREFVKGLHFTLDGEVSQCDGRRLSRMLGGRERLSSVRLQQEEEESVPEETEGAEAPDDAAEVERTEPVQPANDPGTEVSIIEKNRPGGGGMSNKVPFPGAGEVRIRDDDYYTARREFLKSFHFTLDGEVSQCDGRRLSRMLGRRERLSSVRLLA